ETFSLADEDDVYARAADDWAAGQGVVLDADTEQGAAQRIYDLALEFQERSQRSEARLIEQFEDAVQRLAGRMGDLMIVDDEDESGQNGSRPKPSPLTVGGGSSAPSSSRAGRSCPDSGCRRTTRRPSPTARARGSSSTCDPATGRGSSFAGRSRSTRPMPRAA